MLGVYSTQVLQYFKQCDDDSMPSGINALLGHFHDNAAISCSFDHAETTLCGIIEVEWQFMDVGDE